MALKWNFKRRWKKEMCKYCESDYEVNLLSAKENDADVKMFKNRIWLKAYSFIDDPLNDYEEIEINYCPMCGRKLSNKEKRLYKNWK